MNRREIAIGITCLLIGIIASYSITRSQIESNKKLTQRVLKNSIQSITAYKEIADSCSDAYNTATACVSNINTCNIQEETKKLDEYNTRREHADQQIDWMADDMEKIIKEVSAKR